MASRNLVAQADLPAWSAIIGLRNRIVHDYINIDMQQVLDLISNVHVQQGNPKA
ncbi:MAG: hypothetical protein CO065_02210 [Comamonadaceae bacterium CG_4_9_14_0_8_um_filter_57_21]|nr:MAG: hypothetical protein CO065_02210 [Comamonadaceae bacterium CG_4_9_14_0_8_um_filter_57_21]